MAANTILLDFSLDPKKVKNEPQLSVIAVNIENVLRNYLDNLKLISTFSLEKGLFRLYTSDFGSVTSLRVFGSGLITINIEFYKSGKQEPVLTYEKSKALERDIANHVLGISCSSILPPIKRGPFSRYYTTAGERLLEFDIDRLVFEEHTPFQKVQILHSKSFGNMLILDNMQNISEADLTYTETLMARGKENYKGKEIVILGGGDGALLFELLKEQPKNVIMLEIDEVVMRACAKYMRSICGDVLDKYSGPNYQIIIGDCMKSLDQFIKEGRKFDYIFGDLTDIPISDTPTSELWNFIKNILDVSFKVLKPDGKFMTHGNGTSQVEALKMYESQLAKIEPSVTISKTKAFVPSFVEEWVFYQITFEKKE